MSGIGTSGGVREILGLPLTGCKYCAVLTGCRGECRIVEGDEGDSGRIS